MTRNEQRILGPAIKQVIQNNRYAWLDLKREICDLGYQSCYESQGDFLAPAERAAAGLPPEVRSLLFDEWNSATPRRDKISEANLGAAYTLLILEEIIERARVAAYRTENW